MMFTISRSNSTTQTNKNDSMQVSFAIINHMICLFYCYAISSNTMQTMSFNPKTNYIFKVSHGYTRIIARYVQG